MGVDANDEHYRKYRALIEPIDDAEFLKIMTQVFQLHNDRLTYSMLTKEGSCEG